MECHALPEIWFAVLGTVAAVRRRCPCREPGCDSTEIIAFVRFNRNQCFRVRVSSRSTVHEQKSIQKGRLSRVEFLCCFAPAQVGVSGHHRRNAVARRLFKGRRGRSETQTSVAWVDGVPDFRGPSRAAFGSHRKWVTGPLRCAAPSKSHRRGGSGPRHRITQADSPQKGASGHSRARKNVA